MDDNPWLERRVIAYAHQGGAKEAPSSTLYAIRRALEHGVTGIELDVHATKDGHIVVCHDPTLDRTTGATGEIADRSLEELRRLDNAYWFCPGEDAVKGRPERDYVLRGLAPAEGDLGVATLSEVLESFPGVVLQSRHKAHRPRGGALRGGPGPGASRPRPSLRRDRRLVLRRRHGGFRRAHARGGHRRRHGGDLGVLPQAAGRRAPQDDIGRYVALQPPARFGSLRVVDRRFVDAAHACGLAVHVWTVDDPAEMEDLVASGVDGIISDKPSVLAAVLSRLGANWET